MLPLVAGIVSALLQNNLPKIAQAVVDKGLDYVEDKTGIKLEPDMSAEKIAELKLAVLKHEEFQIEQNNKNTADSRGMQIAALSQDDLFSKRFVYFLSSFWSIAAVVYIGFITFGTIPEANVRFADSILGFMLGTVVATVINYFLGSSNQSVVKTDMLKQQLKG